MGLIERDLDWLWRVDWPHASPHLGGFRVPARSRIGSLRTEIASI